MSECKALTGAQAEQYKIDLVFDLPKDDVHALADATRLKQVLLNLVSNTIKYNVENGSVRVNSRQLSEETCRVQIADTGTGIPPARQAQLFEPFNRLGRESGPIDGSGIGLVVSKELIEQMGGTIGFNSKS